MYRSHWIHLDHRPENKWRHLTRLSMLQTFYTMFRLSATKSYFSSTVFFSKSHCHEGYLYVDIIHLVFAHYILLNRKVKLYIIITKDGIARISKYPQIWTLEMGGGGNQLSIIIGLCLKYVKYNDVSYMHLYSIIWFN